MNDDSPWQPPFAGAVPPPPPDGTSMPVAAPPAAPTPPVSPWSVDHVPSAGVFGDSTEIDTIIAGSDDRPRRSKMLVGVGVAAVLAVGAAGVFAVSSFAGSSNGGASSPDELGLALLTALENEDILGAVDVLVPGERDVFRDPLVDVVSELTRLEVLSPDASLSQIAGLDVVLENEVVVVESTNVPDIVNINLQARATATVDGKLLPVGDLIKDNLSDDERQELDDLGLEPQPEPEDLDFSVTAVEQDGRWYFSVFHTIAEAVRADQLPDSGIPLEGIGAVGADSPEAAFDEVLNRVEELDLSGLIQTLNPGEAAALQRYAPLFIDDLEASRADLRFDWKITERNVRVEGDGDTRTVFIDGLGVEGTIEDEPFSASFSGDCFLVSFGELQMDECVSDLSGIEEAEEYFAEVPEVEKFLTTLRDALADMQPSGIEMRKHDGQWFVSPVSTFTEAALNLMRALTRQELDDIIESGRAASDAFFEGIFGGLYGYDEEYADETFEEFSADDPFFDDSLSAATLEEITVSEEIIVDWTECYSELDAGLAIDCFNRYIATGEIDASYLPIELRFPECGYQAAWNELQSLPDAEFVATIEAARPCFLDLVAQGVLEHSELPTEIAYLECFEGRNWYNVFDDPAYDERYYACVDEAIAAADPTSGG